MRINIALILSIIIAVGVVAFGFTAFQISTEREKLNDELKSKTIRNSDEFFDVYLAGLEKGDDVSDKINDTLISEYGFSGIAVYFNLDSVRPLNNNAEEYIKESDDYVSQAMSADSSMGNIVKAKNKNIFEYIRVVRKQICLQQLLYFIPMRSTLKIF